MAWMAVPAATYLVRIFVAARFPNLVAESNFFPTKVARRVSD